MIALVMNMNKWKGRYIKVIHGPHYGTILHVLKYVGRNEENEVEIMANEYCNKRKKKEQIWIIDMPEHEYWEYIPQEQFVAELL